MEIAQWVTFEVHDRYINLLFKPLTRKPLTGFHSVSVQQIHELDAEVFLKLSEQTREGLDLNGDGTYRLDALMLDVMADPLITMLAMPRQKPVGHAPTDNKRSFSDFQSSEWSQTKGAGKGAKGKGQGKSDGKTKRGKRSKDKQNGPRSMVPDAFKDAKGRMTTIHNGKRICFAYNLQGCNLPVGPTGECIKGAHVCAREGCGGNHPQHYENCAKLR